MRLPLGPAHPLALTAALALLAGTAGAQSLGEVAARTKEKEKKGAKVYTETDLRGRPGAGTVSQPEGPGAVASVDAPKPEGTAAEGEKKPEGAAAAPAGEKPKTEEELKAEAQAEWRGRKTKADEDVARLSADVAKLQNLLGDLTGPMYGGGRTALLNRMEETKKQLATAQQTQADVDEEGRRKGYR
jgi:hypothetical protein